MSEQPDLTVVELHRVDGPLVIEAIQGDVWHFPDGKPGPTPVEVGASVQIRDTLALSAGSTVTVGTLRLSGGRRGRAHALVPADAFQTPPRRADVPRLLEQLAGIEAEAVKLGEDPLAMQRGPEDPAREGEVGGVCPTEPDDERREGAAGVGRSRRPRGRAFRVGRYGVSSPWHRSMSRSCDGS